MESQQGRLRAVLVTTYTATTVCVACRFFSRYLARTPLWCDDYAALASYVAATVYSILCHSWIRIGVGLHVQDIAYAPVAKVIYNVKLHLFASELIYAASLFWGQVSILCLYWRIFSVPEARLAVKIILPFTLAWLIVRILMSIFHCRPVHHFWDASVRGECGFTNTWFYFGTRLIHLLIDVYIMVIPIKQIMKLRLTVGQKFGTAAMFLFGILTSAAAGAVMIEAMAIDETDISWSVARPLVWAIAEVNLVAMSTSLPTIKPVFVWCFGCLSPGRRKLPLSPISTKTRHSWYTKDRQSVHLLTMPYGDQKGVIPSWRSTGSVDYASLDDWKVYLGDGQTVVTRYAKGNSPISWRDGSLRADAIRPRQRENGIQVWCDMTRPQKSLWPEPRLVRRITRDFVVRESRLSERKKRAT